MSSARSDLELALDLADLADSITTGAFRSTGLVVETKPDLTPVTATDRLVEQRLREAIGRARPGDAVVGEEYGTSGGGSRRWIVDPIDGTKNFVRGIPVWASLVALEVGGVITAGVVSAPALGRRWWASRGAGAFAGRPGERGTLIRVSAVADLGDAQVSYSSLSGWEPDAAAVVGLATRCWRSRAFGDFWSHVLVAEGACDIGLDPVVSIWDLAPLQVIVEEAGGAFTDLSGAPRVDGGSAVSSNGLLHSAVLQALRV